MKQERTLHIEDLYFKYMVRPVLLAENACYKHYNKQNYNPNLRNVTH